MPELRRVQRTATGTFFVCLPRAWAEKQGLKKGSQVSLAETEEGKILVDPRYDAKPQPRVAVLAVGPFLGREIFSRYLCGYDTIRIESSNRIDPDVRNTVKSAVSLVIGLGIVEETASHLVLQCWLEPSGFPPEKVLQQIGAIVSGMLRDAADSLLEGDVQLAQGVVARDDESDRLYFLLVRILRIIVQNRSLAEKVGMVPLDCLDYRLAAKLVEAIGDSSAKAAAKAIELNGAKPPGDVRDLLCALQAVCSEALEHSLKAFLGKDAATAENVRNLREKIRKVSTDVEKIAKTQPAEVISLALAASSLLQQAYEYSVDLADLVA